MRSIAWAVRTGRVDFSTTILLRVEWARICRAVFSQYCRSAARPAPWPGVFVYVHRHEDDVGLADARRGVGREEEVAPARNPHDLFKAWLVDREVVAVPRSDPRLVDVDDRHPEVRALGGNHRHGGAADVAGADAEDVRGLGHGRVSR
jgi:hypothetical protein